jgi:5S rRNA maturation endonuclease (ribonuclease M5)
MRSKKLRLHYRLGVKFAIDTRWPYHRVQQRVVRLNKIPQNRIHHGHAGSTEKNKNKYFSLRELRDSVVKEEATMRDRKAKKFLEELSLINESVPIIVEGYRDVQTLRALGMQGEIVKLHTGRSIQQWCEEFSEHHWEAVILTDWDNRGNQLFHLVTRFMDAKWEPYNHFRETLRELAGGSFQQVERMMVWEHLSLANSA